MSSRRGGRSSVGLLLALGVGGVVAMILIIVLTTGNSGSPEAPTSYQSYNTSIDTSFGTGAPGFAIGESTAPVTIVEYSDFSCSFCARLAEDVEQVIEDYVSEGQVRVIYKPITFVAPPASTDAAKGAYCAAEQGYAWEMQEQLWDIYSINGTGGFTLRNITTYANTIDGLNVDEWRGCFNAPSTIEALNAVGAEAQQLGINATPTVFLNGEQLTFQSDPGSELIAAIENALN